MSSFRCWNVRAAPPQTGTSIWKNEAHSRSYMMRMAVVSAIVKPPPGSSERYSVTSVFS